MAAVFPAQPEPMITTSRMFCRNAFLTAILYFSMWLRTTTVPVSADAAKFAAAA